MTPHEFVQIKNIRRTNELSDSPGALRGLELYGACKVYCHMAESVRLDHKEFQEVNTRAANYELTEDDIDTLNSYVKPKAELYTDHWLSGFWIFPTWDLIHQHLSKVTNFMAQTRGVHRVWSRPLINTQNLSDADVRRVVRTYYTNTSTTFDGEFKDPLPYIDLFPGQIINLIKNYIPSLGFHKNAKVIVVGVHYHDQSRILPPIATVDEAVELAMHDDGYPAYDVLVRFYEPKEEKDSDEASTELQEKSKKKLQNQYKGPSALEATPGVFTLPWTSKTKKVCNAQINVSGLCAHPANAVTGHQIQGATYNRCAAAVLMASKKWYGWANVATSRTKASAFAMLNKVTLGIMQAQPAFATIVADEMQRLLHLRNYVFFEVRLKY